MRRIARKWKNALVWIVLLCFIMGIAMAVYTYFYESDRFSATYLFFVQPNDTTADSVANLSMLARDCKALMKTDTFKNDVLQKEEITDEYQISIEGIEGTHLLEIHVIGCDMSKVQVLANAAGEWMKSHVQSELHATGASAIDKVFLSEEPISPNRPLRVLQTLIVTFLAGSLLSCFFGSNRETVYANAYAQKELCVPRVGAIADYRAQLKCYLKKSNSSDVCSTLLMAVDRLVLENVRAVVMSLRVMLSKEHGRSIVVTGMREDEGKSSFVLLLASELAQQSFRVLLIDLEGGHCLSRLLNVSGSADLFGYLNGSATLEQIVMETPISNLSFIDDHQGAASVASIAGTENFVNFVRSAAMNFDFVLLNAAPVGICADASMLGAVAEMTLLAAADGRYSVQELNTVVQGLSGVVKRFAGLVLTHVPEHRIRPYVGASIADGCDDMKDC